MVGGMGEQQVRRGSRRQQLKQEQQQQQQAQAAVLDGDDAASGSAASGEAKQQPSEKRGQQQPEGRSTRSKTGKGVMDDWVKIPVTVNGRVGAGGETEPVDGWVFVSMQDGRTFRVCICVCVVDVWVGVERLTIGVD